MYIKISYEIINTQPLDLDETIYLGVRSQDKVKDRKDGKDKDGKDGKDGDSSPEPILGTFLKKQGLFADKSHTHFQPINIGNDLPKKIEFEGSSADSTENNQTLEIKL